MLLFNNFFYIIFLAVALLFYFIVPKKYRWIVLLIFSVLFYVSFSYKFAFFILSTIVTIYLASLYFAKVENSQKSLLDNFGKQIDADSKKKLKKHNKTRKRVVLALTILFNIGILFTLKYLNFMGGVINDIAGWFSAGPVVPKFSLILPLGISFYTFQAIGYLVDCYWKKITPQRNFFKFSLFLTFFPQIIQGPISRYEQIGDALVEGGDFNLRRLVRGGQLIVWGLFKKMVVADLFCGVVDSVFANFATANSLIVILGILFYFFQDYADFSGCIDIARGSAECFGVNLPDNFERPYFALSIAEYWRRWHMTLGTWFKDYIFYPISVSKFSLKLGKVSKKVFGSFGKNIPAIFGLLVTWLATGVWHGASWNYIVWGLYFGILIILQIVTKPLCDKLMKKLKIDPKNIFWRIFSWFRTFVLLLIGRTIFRADSLKASWDMFVRCFQIFRFDFSGIAEGFYAFNFNAYTAVAIIGFLLILAVDLYKEFRPTVSVRDKVAAAKIWISWPIYIVLILCIFILGAYGISYNAADFIYMQF